MALTNFTLPFGSIAQPVHHWGATASPLHQLATNTNNLLYSPADHQQQEESNQQAANERDYYKNNPYAPPQLHQQQQQKQQQQPQQQQYNNQYNNNNNNARRKGGNTYLPPIPPPGARNTQYHHQQQQPQQPQQHLQQTFSHYNTQQQQQVKSTNVAFKAATNTATASTRTYGEGSYNRYPAASTAPSPSSTHQATQPNQHFGFNSYSQTRTSASSSTTFNTQQQQQQHQKSIKQTTKTTQSFDNQNTDAPTSVPVPSTAYGAADVDSIGGNVPNDIDSTNGNDAYPHRPPGFTRVQAGQGSRTQVHAVLDYDAEEGEEDYYDENDNGEEVNQDGSTKSAMPTVTPIQGPIYLKNGTVPVVPLLSYPTINNGSFVQIPIWWTALSVALGLDVRGDIIKGVPCVKRFHQLFCPTAGNSYPIDKIERFIDENKALMRRMYGDFEMNLDAGGPRQQTKKRKRRFIDEPDIFVPPGVYPSIVPDDHDDAVEAGDTYFGKLRTKRQSGNQNQNRNTNRGGSSFGQTSGPRNTGPGANTGSSTGRLDTCESKVEIVTPYWASNSAGKIRAIVNTQHFEQAIHQEICSKAQTPRCDKDCGCEQKYKWHRLLAYDPDNDCKGIFMDWFLFPSCCVCRCNP